MVVALFFCGVAFSDDQNEKNIDNSAVLVEDVFKKKEDEIKKDKHSDNTELRKKAAKTTDVQLPKGQKNQQSIIVNNGSKENINRNQLNNVYDSNLDKEKVVAKSIADEILTKDKFGIKIDNLFVNFDVEDVLDFDYNKIKFDNFGFLENEEELSVIKHMLKEQQDPELKKIREERDRLRQEVKLRIRNLGAQVERSLKIYSLVFLDDKNWEVKINRETFNSKNRANKTLFDTGIVKVNKKSVIFLIKKVDDMAVERVRLIKKKRLPYSDNYYLVKKGKKTYIGFKMFNGQKINLDTMIITG